MLNFTNPAGQLATDDDPLVVHKFISQPLFGGGQVILRPGAEKGRQFVRNDTMVSRKSFGLRFCKNAAENLAVEFKAPFIETNYSAALILFFCPVWHIFLLFAFFLQKVASAFCYERW